MRWLLRYILSIAVVIQFAGERGGWIFSDSQSGFNYVYHRVRNGTVYCKCINHSIGRKRARKKKPVCDWRGKFELAWANEEDAGILVSPTHPHTCQPDFDYEYVCTFQRHLLHYAYHNPSLQPMQIWCNVFRDKEITGRAHLHKMRRSMNRERAKHQATLPRTFEELEVELQRSSLRRTLDEGNPVFFQERQQIQDQGENLIFYSQGTAEEFFARGNGLYHVDATFKVVPRTSGCTQLLVIFGVKNDYAVPVVFVLMRRKTKAAYLQIYNHLKSKFPEMNPRKFITDFETGMQEAIRESFPNASIVGCWFHYAQNILKHARMLGLTPILLEAAAAKIFSLLLVLPLLPPNEILSGLEDVIKAAKDANLGEKLKPLTDYISETWIHGIGTEFLSVWRQPQRTNNNAECFAALLLSFIRAKPGLWDFFSKLQDIEHFYASLLEGMRQGNIGVRPQKMKYVVQDGRIRTASIALERGRISRMDFLNAVKYVTKTLVNGEVEKAKKRGSVEEEEDDNDEIIGQVEPPVGRPFVEALEKLGSTRRFSGKRGISGKGRLQRGISRPAPLRKKTSHRQRRKVVLRGGIKKHAKKPMLNKEVLAFDRPEPIIEPVPQGSKDNPDNGLRVVNARKKSSIFLMFGNTAEEKSETKKASLPAASLAIENGPMNHADQLSREHFIGTVHKIDGNLSTARCMDPAMKNSILIPEAHTPASYSEHHLYDYSQGSDAASASNFSDTLTASEFSNTASEFSDTASACSEAPDAVIDALFAEAGPVLESCSVSSCGKRDDSEMDVEWLAIPELPEEDYLKRIPPSNPNYPNWPFEQPPDSRFARHLRLQFGCSSEDETDPEDSDDNTAPMRLQAISRKKIRSIIKEARNRDYIKSSDVRGLGLPGVLERHVAYDY